MFQVNTFLSEEKTGFVFSNTAGPIQIPSFVALINSQIPKFHFCSAGQFSFL